LSFGIADQVFELSRVPLYASAEIPLENTEEFSVSSVDFGELSRVVPYLLLFSWNY
jgi:hypothetical protein